MRYLHNFRDTGGLTLPGGQLRRGMLYRSAAPMHRTNEADRHLRELGIRVVVDLRDDAERALLPPAWRGSGALVHAMPVFENMLRDIRFSSLDELYTIMLERHAPALARAFTRIAESAGTPTLVHCTAGKDRTGVLIGLIHEVLGVHRDDTLNSYSLSQGLLGADYLDDLFRNIQPEDLPGGAAHRAVSSPPELLNALFDAIDAQYGGAEAFLLTHGVRIDSIDRLRTQLSQPVTVPAK